MEYTEHGLAYDTHLEESTLGIILTWPDQLTRVLSECKLRKNSFYLERNRLVFDKVVEIFDKGIKPEFELVSSELNGTVPKNYVLDLVGKTPPSNKLLPLANRLVELERWRNRGEAITEAKIAVQQQSIEAFSIAKAKLDNDEIRTNSSKSAKSLGENFAEYMKGEKVEAFPLPYRSFNERMAGGLRRKQMTIIGGWSSHGKSVVVDQFMEHFAKLGFKCHLYINEMGIEDRVARSVARCTGVSYQRLTQHKLKPGDKEKVEKVLEDGCPYFDITECAGWSIHELAYDIKSRNYDVIAVDILHLFDYDSEVELARISRLLNRTAKQANSHILASVHLNEFRANDIVRPRPVLRDIRGSGMLKNDADNVMFIHREQDPGTGDPTPPSTIYTAKVRNGQMGHVPLMFQEKTFSFTEDID